MQAVRLRLAIRVPKDSPTRQGSVCWPDGGRHDPPVVVQTGRGETMCDADDTARLEDLVPGSFVLYGKKRKEEADKFLHKDNNYTVKREEQVSSVQNMESKSLPSPAIITRNTVYLFCLIYTVYILYFVSIRGEGIV